MRLTFKGVECNWWRRFVRVYDYRYSTFSWRVGDWYFITNRNKLNSVNSPLYDLRFLQVRGDLIILSASSASDAKPHYGSKLTQSWDGCPERRWRIPWSRRTSRRCRCRPDRRRWSGAADRPAAVWRRKRASTLESSGAPSAVNHKNQRKFRCLPSPNPSQEQLINHGGGEGMSESWAHLHAVEELGVLVLRLDGVHGGVEHLVAKEESQRKPSYYYVRWWNKLGGDKRRQQWRRAIQISESLLSAGLADLEAHPKVEEDIGHQHQHDVAVLLGELDRHRHGCKWRTGVRGWRAAGYGLDSGVTVDRHIFYRGGV